MLLISEGHTVHNLDRWKSIILTDRGELSEVRYWVNVIITDGPRIDLPVNDKVIGEAWAKNPTLWHRTVTAALQIHDHSNELFTVDSLEQIYLRLTKQAPRVGYSA